MDTTDWLAEARFIAWKIRRFHPGVDQDDAVSAAGEAIARLLNEFDPERGNVPAAHIRQFGVPRAIDILREDGSMHRPEQNPPKTVTNIEIEICSEADTPFPIDLFEHPSLTDCERRVLVLKYTENRLFAEIAQQLKISEHGAQDIHRVAINKLRDAIV